MVHGMGYRLDPRHPEKIRQSLGNENGHQRCYQWSSSEDVAETSDGGVRSGVIDLIASTSFS